MIYAIVSFDFTDANIEQSFKDILRDCGAMHEKNMHTYALHDPALFEHMIKAIEEWKERMEFDYTDYVRVYSPAGGAGTIAFEDLV